MKQCCAVGAKTMTISTNVVTLCQNLRIDLNRHKKSCVLVWSESESICEEVFFSPSENSLYEQFIRHPLPLRSHRLNWPLAPASVTSKLRLLAGRVLNPDNSMIRTMSPLPYWSDFG